MSSQKLEYDSTLGGAVVVGSHVPTYRYAADVVQEMRQLLSAVKSPTSKKLVFQTLPKHMRRRAMSHHPKRLPRKYRASHRSQMAKAGNPQATRRPSRKYRRRSSNLLREYLRRQRRCIWLETHIWHARRFHMVNRWGYRLPYASCDKTYRACYRATAEHCLLQDISFHSCLQLEGSVDDLREGFACLSAAQCGLGIAAKTFLNGRREGSIELFKDGQYPTGALGRVSFMWCPVKDQEAGVTMEEKMPQRKLWIWVHPSAYSNVLEEIIKIFNLESLRSRKVVIQPVDDPKEQQRGSQEYSANHSNKTQQRLQFMTKTFAYERIKRYANEASSVHLSELKDTINRFRLTGPLAQSVLSQAFKVKHGQEEVRDIKIETNWFTMRMQTNPNFHSCHVEQEEFWQQCGQQVTSPTELMSNMILALNIEDPRIHRPRKRTKATPAALSTGPQTDASNLLLGQISKGLSESALYDTKLRDSLHRHMISTHEYNELRSKHVLLPGGACQFEKHLQPVPVLLVQRPGSQQPHHKRLGYGCGWDVIVPAGYGMPVWMSLIMWGARPGGLREFEMVAKEAGEEQHFPDTVAGHHGALERYKELHFKYFRLPPNRRCNFRKLAIVSPFRAPFRELVRDWSAASTTGSPVDFHVLRDSKLLLELDQCLKHKERPFPPCFPPGCLIQLQLRMKSRGSISEFALICLPKIADLKRNLKQIRNENHEPVYTEPLMGDVLEKERNIMRREHKQLLKRLRARRVREKRKQQEISNKRVHIRPAATAQLVAEHFKKLCGLWLPTEPRESEQSVRKQCTREVFGYTTSGGFSYTEGTTCANGYVTAAGLQQLLMLCHQARLRQPLCLVRGTKSRHYRFATFKLNLQDNFMM